MLIKNYTNKSITKFNNSGQASYFWKQSFHNNKNKTKYLLFILKKEFFVFFVKSLWQGTPLKQLICTIDIIKSEEAPWPGIDLP